MKQNADLLSVALEHCFMLKDFQEERIFFINVFSLVRAFKQWQLCICFLCFFFLFKFYYFCFCFAWMSVVACELQTTPYLIYQHLILILVLSHNLLFFLFFIFYFICLFELEENQEQWNPLEHLILREDTAESFTKKCHLSDCESTFNYFHLFLLLSHSWMRINWCYILSKSFEIIVIHSKSNYCCFKCFSWLI